MIKLCDYGCGEKANYYFKTVNKWCCSNYPQKCSKQKNKISITMKEKTFSNDHLKNLKISRNKRKMTKWSTEQREKLSSKRKGINNSMFGKRHSTESKKKIGLKSLGRKHNEEFKEKMRVYMNNGGHQYTSSFITKISKEEKQLREMVKELYPDCSFQFKVFRYEIDVAIPNKKIAIEFDGWFHFDTEEHKQYHKVRQEKIENEGWKFLRYTIFDKFPTLEKLKEDLNKIIEE
jgi:very-short-patch-repair endonuclease